MPGRPQWGPISLVGRAFAIDTSALAPTQIEALHGLIESRIECEEVVDLSVNGRTVVFFNDDTRDDWEIACELEEVRTEALDYPMLWRTGGRRG